LVHDPGGCAPVRLSFPHLWPHPQQVLISLTVCRLSCWRGTPGGCTPPAPLVPFSTGADILDCMQVILLVRDPGGCTPPAPLVPSSIGADILDCMQVILLVRDPPGVYARGGHRHLHIGRMHDIDLISEPPTPPPPRYMFPKCENLCGQRGRKRFKAS
jgi:hypothetical protein